MSIKLAQISDCHIDTKPIDNIDTQQQLTKIINDINTRGVNNIILSGDLVHNANNTNYKTLLNCLKTLKKANIYAIYGNHDDEKLFYKHLSNYCHKFIELDKWRIIFINSVVKNKVYGYINAQQLTQLESNILTTNQNNIMLILHHPATSMQSSWDDKLSLTNPDDLFDIVKKYKKIKAISWGHSHEYKVFKKHNIKLYSCPSSVKQFTKEQKKSGYLEFQLLDNGDIKHKVIWI